MIAEWIGLGLIELGCGGLLFFFYLCKRSIWWAFGLLIGFALIFSGLECLGES